MKSSLGKKLGRSNFQITESKALPLESHSELSYNIWVDSKLSIVTGAASDQMLMSCKA